MNEEAYAYISGYDLNNTLFDISGIMQARKNKNEVPFIYYKVENVISNEDKKKCTSIIEIVKHFGLEPIDMSADKIKLTEKKH